MQLGKFHLHVQCSSRIHLILTAMKVECDSVTLNCSAASVVGNAKEVGAVSHLEVAVRLIVIADEG